MRKRISIFSAAILTVAFLALCCQKADAGRLGGPASGWGTVPAHQSYYIDVPFVRGEPAVVDLAGNGNTFLDLYIYDAYGNIAAGNGYGDRKRAVIMNVLESGYLRIEVRNAGSAPNTFFLGTN